MAEEMKQEEAQSGADIQVTESGQTPAEGQRKSALATLSHIEQEVEKAFDRIFRGSWLPSLKEMLSPAGTKVTLPQGA